MLRRTCLGVLLALTCILSALPERAQAQPTPRYAHTLTLLPHSGMMLVGGIGAGGVSINSVEIFRSTDGLLGAFTAASLLTARSSHTATLLPDGRILVVGGISAAGVVLNTGEIYDANRNVWTAVGNNMGAVDGQARFNHTATLMRNGRVLIVGGQSNLASATNRSCNFFNPITDLFEACAAGGTGDMSAPNGRAGHTASLLNDGRILITGGYDSTTGNYLVTTELFDGQNPGAFISGPALLGKRAWHSATGLGNGKVLICGGYNTRNFKENLGILRTCELYDPVSNTISPAAPMTVRRMAHSATLRPSGEVRIMSGLGNITTSFTQIPAAFQTGSILRFNPTNGQVSATTGTIISTDPITLAEVGFLDVEMSVPASALIVNGEVRFSSPQITALPGVLVRFANRVADGVLNPGTTAPMAGMSMAYGPGIDSAVISTMTARITFPTGQGFFDPFDVALTDDALIAGSLAYAGGPLPGEGGPVDLTPGAAANLIRLPGEFGMPEYMFEARITTGQARIVSGAISRQSDENTHGFSIALTSGTAYNLAGCGPVVFDAVAGYTIGGCNMDFRNGIEGTITSSSADATVALPNPVNIAGDLTTGFTARLSIVPSRLLLGGQSFSFDIATMVVRQALMGDVEIYNPEDNEWRSGRFNLTPRMQGTAISHPNGDAIIFGGRNCTDARACEALTPATIPSGVNPAWAESYSNAIIPTFGFDNVLADRASMSQARSNHTATVLTSGHVLVAGGTAGASTVRTSERYNPIDDTWKAVGLLHDSRSNHTATLLPNSTVMVAGGFTKQESTGSTQSVEIYYPDTELWLPTTPLISSRSFHTSVILPDGNVMVMGGLGGSGQYLNSVEIYYSTSRVWATLPAMASARSQHSATLLQDGRVLVAGGVGPGGVLGLGGNDVEVYDPTTNSWSSLAPMTRERHSHTAGLLVDGRVLMSGGNDGFAETGTTDIYDPKTNTWQFVTNINTGATMVIPRQDHTSIVLPNNRVLSLGGFTALLIAQDQLEDYDVARGTWTTQGVGNRAIGNHTTVLLANNRVVNLGGNDGLVDRDEVEDGFFSGEPDSASGTGGNSLRRPNIVKIDTGTVLPGQNISFSGSNFLGGTEASGGAAGPGDVENTVPEVIFRRFDMQGNNAGNSSSFMINLGSRVLNTDTFDGGTVLTKWQTIDSSMTLTLPASNSELPYGYYQARIGINGQYSDGATVLVGPPVPSGQPSIPIGTLVGVSSVSWAWAEVLPAPDGYNIYSATNGVFLSTLTVNACVAGTCTFIQRGLGPDTSALIKVAAYSLSGDGQVTISTVAVNTISSQLSGVTGLALSTDTIQWSWAANPSASSYSIFSASAGVQIGSVLTNSFLEIGLTTNTIVGIRVRAETDAGPGQLTGATSVYTLAAVPLPAAPTLHSVSTGGFIADWLENTNPSDITVYRIDHFNDIAPSTVSVFVGSRTFEVINSTPNLLFTVSVTAFNGDSIPSATLVLGSTATLANPPISPAITGQSPNSISLSWDANSNPSTTTYQIVISSDNFLTDISTPVAFSAGLRVTNAVLSGLFTETVYSIRISAQNQFGIETAFVSTTGFTSGGGGPPGSLSLFIPRDASAQLSGNLGNGRQIQLVTVPGTFDEDVTIFISSRDITELPFTCGNINAVVQMVTIPPGKQPLQPFSFSMQWLPADGVTVEEHITMMRLDETANSCVTNYSVPNKFTNVVESKINHLSLFQLQQISPQANSVSDVRIFPNPLWTRTGAHITFDKLPAAARIRIYTLQGERVVDIPQTNASGVAIWNATNNAGRPVASGIYIAVIEFEGKKEIKKLAVIR
jgi:hypothetical protein